MRNSRDRPQKPVPQLPDLFSKMMERLEKNRHLEMTVVLNSPSQYRVKHAGHRVGRLASWSKEENILLLFLCR
jgi:hypothetical protein